MATNTHLSLESWNASLNAILGPLNGGVLGIYGGAQPANPDIPVTNQPLLATLQLGSPAFAPASGGTAIAEHIASTVASQSGAAAWFRAYEPGGEVAVIDGSVGTSDCDMNINDVAITQGGNVSITSWTIGSPAGQ